MRELLAATIAFQHNFRILHWKVTTTDFDTVHSLMERYVNEFEKFIDLFAECLMMLGEQPVSFIEVQSILTESNNNYNLLSANEYFTPQMVFEVLENNLTIFQRLLRNVLSQDSIPRGIQSELELVDFWVSKELDYKNKHRLKGNRE